MRVCLITDKPGHPVLAQVCALLGERHEVTVMDPTGVDPAQAARDQLRAPTDVYLLKSHLPAALEVARSLDGVGALVVNNAAATATCGDRVRMTDRLTTAGIPAPPIVASALLADVANDAAVSARDFPVMVKSRASRRDDLVCRVDSAASLAALVASWGAEPVIVQPFIENDGWDRKLWVVDGEVFAGRRRTPLDAVPSKDTAPIPAHRLPVEWVEIARAVGAAFSMPLYGLDMVLTPSGPVVVDVNAFPGFRGVPGASEALAGYVDRLGWQHVNMVTA